MPYGQVLVDTVKDSLNNTFAPASSVFRNRIINGAMVIDQRNAGTQYTTPTTSSIVYLLDRYYYYVTAASKFTIQQNAGSVTPPVGFSNYLGITSTSAYSVSSSDQLSIGQRIEGFNCSDLGWGTANAKTVTLSFWVYSSLTGTFGGVINNTGSYTYPFTYSIPTASTWTQISITIPGPTAGSWGTGNSSCISIIFGIGVGSSFLATAGTWASSGAISATGATSVVGTSGATFYITGVQLEVGTNATNFEYRPYGTELALCQRYYVNMNGTGNSYQPLFIGALYNTTSGSYIMNLPVPMRTVPTITTSGTIYAQNLSINISSLAGPYSQIGSLLEGDFTLASASTSGNFCFVRWNNIATGSRSFNISAEL
jgi:hypothetical protein